MTTFINLSQHPSVQISNEAPWVEGEKNGRPVKFADLQDLTIEEYLTKYILAVLPANSPDSGYVNPQVKQANAGTWIEGLDNGMFIEHSVGEGSIVEGLPAPQEGVVFITSYPVASNAKRPDVVSPITVANPETGFAMGAIGYCAFG
jgi:hypothetical protein